MAKFTLCTKYVDVRKEVLIIQHLYEKGACDEKFQDNNQDNDEDHSETNHNKRSIDDGKIVDTVDCENPPAIIENDKALESLEFGCQPSDVAAELEFTRFFMSLNEYERIVIGHDFKDFIKGCTFQGQDCLKRK